MKTSDDDPGLLPAHHANAYLLPRRIVRAYLDQVYVIMQEEHVNRIRFTLPFYGNLCYEETQNKETYLRSSRIPWKDNGPECTVSLPCITLSNNLSSVRSCRQPPLSTIIP